MGKGTERFLKSRNLERAEDRGEGSSGRKVEEAGKKWYLKNGYIGEEDDEYEDEEDLLFIRRRSTQKVPVVAS
jgi:hypothetical protein